MYVDKMDFNELHEFLTDSFPHLTIRDLSERYPEGVKGEALEIRGDGETFPIRTDFCSTGGIAGYEEGISVMFTDWITSIGWHVECYDYGTYEIMRFQPDGFWCPKESL